LLIIVFTFFSLKPYFSAISLKLTLGELEELERLEELSEWMKESNE